MSVWVILPPAVLIGALMGYVLKRLLRSSGAMGERAVLIGGVLGLLMGLGAAQGLSMLPQASATDGVVHLARNGKHMEAMLAEGRPLQFVLFSAPWCGACREFKPTYKKLAERFQFDADFHIFNVDKDRAYLAQFGFRAIPTVIVFQDGQMMGMVTGAVDSEFIRSFLPPS